MLKLCKEYVHITLWLVCFLLVGITNAQQPKIQLNDSTQVSLYVRGNTAVNKCTPLDHLKCIYITGVEVIEDGLEGKATRHWWRMSYIGTACTEQYGTTFGYIFEGFFAVPHYISIGIVNGTTWVLSLFKRSPEKSKKR